MLRSFTALIQNSHRTKVQQGIAARETKELKHNNRNKSKLMFHQHPPTDLKMTAEDNSGGLEQFEEKRKVGKNRE